jgi:hypothetical protein
MVRDSFTLFQRYLIRDDWKALIHLHCVAIDDLTIEA